MLTRSQPARRYLPGARRHRSRGVVLILVLIVLVAMTIAGLSLVRSTQTANLVAGNLAFQQSGTNEGDQGVEQAINWLETNNNQTTSSTASTCTGTSPSQSSVLACDQYTNGHGYFSSRQDPGSGVSWNTYWNTTLASNAVSLAQNINTGNTVSYVIHRMCDRPGDASATGVNCSSSPTSTGGTCGASSCGAGRVNLNSISQVYYRITVQISGPRNTVNYIQAMVAM